MGVFDEKEYPFLREEKVLIKEYFRKGIPVLGICLGSQLIANALEAKVSYKQEIGWYEVRKANSDKITEKLPENLMVFQWHNDTFDLPENAKILYEGDIVQNQAFRCRKLFDAFLELNSNLNKFDYCFILSYHFLLPQSTTSTIPLPSSPFHLFL